MQNDDYYFYHPDFDYYEILKKHVDVQFADKYTNHFKYYIHLLYTNSFNTKTFVFDCKCKFRAASRVYNYLGNLDLRKNKSRADRLGFDRKRFSKLFSEILISEQVIINNINNLKHKGGSENVVFTDKTTFNMVSRSETILTLDPNFFNEYVIKSDRITPQIKAIQDKIFKRKQKKKNMEVINYDDLMEDDHKILTDEFENSNKGFKVISGIDYGDNYYNIQKKHLKQLKVDTKATLKFFESRYKPLVDDIKNQIKSINKSDIETNEKDRHITILRLRLDEINTKIYTGKTKIKNFNKKDTHFNVVADSGRLYTTFSMFNADYRQFIDFYGKTDLYESDTPCSQPRMVLLRDDIFTESDIDYNYRDLIENGDIYTYLADKLGTSRAKMKKLLFRDVFFSSKYYMNPLRKIFNDEFPKLGKKIKEIILDNNKIMAFYLQNIEAKLLMIVGKQLNEEKIKYVTIHDCIITNNAVDAKRVQKLMSETFKTNIEIKKIR